MASRAAIVTFPGPQVVKITLNRPECLNALNMHLLDDLTQALREHATARVIILDGAGARAFCAGEDLKQTLAPKTGSTEELRLSFTKLQDITRLTASSSAIIVAAVHGFAIGGGAEIALAADFVIGGPDTKFKFPEVRIGHAVTGGISLRLVQLVGLLKAKELLLLGRFVEANEALRIGLLNEISDDPKKRAVQLGLELALLPAMSASCLKGQVERAAFSNMETVLQDEINVASICFLQSDAAKAYTDFAKRKEGKNPPSPHKAVSSSLTATPFDPVTQISREANVATTEGQGSIKDINTALKRVVEASPNKCFLRFAGRPDITYREFDSSISALAGGLRNLGVGRGDRVLVMMSNSVEMVHTWMATNRLGAIWVPINVELKSLTLRHVAEAAHPKLAIVDAEFRNEITSTEALPTSAIYVADETHTNALSQLYTADSPVHIHEAAQVTASTTSAFLYTSGTTGRSKPCVLSHQYFILQATILIESFQLHSEDVLFCPFPLFHADATALTVIPALLLGATAAISTRFSVSKFWDEIRASRSTVYDFMGATLALTYKQPPTDRDRDHNVRLAWGVPVPSFVDDYEKRFGHPIYTLYGSVECSIPIVQNTKLSPPGSCGTLRPGYQLRIADDEDEPLPPNTPGNLLLRSDQPNAFFQGYFNDPQATLNATSNLWLHTGDLAKVDEHGNVYFVGRIKDLIRRRGVNINACEVEEEFLAHPDVVIAAAYAIPSELGSGTEDDVKVAVKVREGSVVDESALWEWAVERMARFQVPSVIEIVDEFEKTPTGKIEKRLLKPDGGKRFDIRSKPRTE